MRIELERIEETEQTENDGNDNRFESGDGDGDGGNIGADFGAVGVGNGASGGDGGDSGDGDGERSGSGSGGDSDSIGGGGNGLGDSGGVEFTPGGSGGDDGVAPRRKRGRPRKQRDDGRNRATGTDAGTGTGHSGKRKSGGLFGDFQENAPRSVKPDQVFEDKSDFLKFTKSEKQKFAAEVLGSLFLIPANLLNAPHWELSGKESADLAKAILDVIETFPAKQSKKVEKLLKEYAPYISLLMVGFAVVYPRVMFTYESRITAGSGAGRSGSRSESVAGNSGSIPFEKGDQQSRGRGGLESQNDVEAYFGHIFGAD